MTTRSPAPPGTWAPARRAAAALAAPIQRILAIEAASGIVLLVATAIALACANSGLHGAYHALWETPIGVALGDWQFVRPLHFWVNDGLMTLFFFVVGLEIRREIYEGELATLRQAALPLAAALGGMAVPALLYFALNAGRAGAGGWAVPMATDIAFAVGVLALLGSRVPGALRVLLLALAVIDDIGAILVIAIVYSTGIEPLGFAVATGGIAVVLAMRAAAVRTPLLYLAPGIVIWAGLYHGGIHPTLAGVLLGLLTPVRPWLGAAGFNAMTQSHLDDMQGEVSRDALLAHLDEIEHARREAVSPVERLVHALHPWVAFVIMPIFALANAGVAVGGATLAGDAGWVFAGIIVGLALGKPLGILVATVAAGATPLAARSSEQTVRGVLLVGIVGGIGFTMSIFVAGLAFPPGPLLETAKLAILIGSATSILAGLAFGAATLRRGQASTP